VPAQRDGRRQRGIELAGDQLTPSQMCEAFAKVPYQAGRVCFCIIYATVRREVHVPSALPEPLPPPWLRLGVLRLLPRLAPRALRKSILLPARLLFPIPIPLLLPPAHPCPPSPRYAPT
jgi:hypothetical protein